MKTLLVAVICIFAFSIVAAQSLTIEFPNGNSFESGEPITFKVTLYDDSGKPLDGQINVKIEDSVKKSVTHIVQSTSLASVEFNGASSGQGIITAEYNGVEAIEFFEIGRKELIQFELEDEKLIVTNIGNSLYTKTIKITIGETVTTQEPNLEVGESISYRLIAPDGTYNVVISDGTTTLTRGGVKLSGTGRAIGALDESASDRSPLTGVTSPDEGSDIALLSYIQRNQFVYVFVAVVFAATILIAIERNYKRKAK